MISSRITQMNMGSFPVKERLTLYLHRRCVTGSNLSSQENLCLAKLEFSVAVQLSLI